ncbi:MAG TPA: NADH-quinone oxidoreductase subunit H [Candidatus Polarisedimenticolia bacterium]|nr:NADH-quinone oxidoreductase subunit H [Candidatus Polarisedimenticolia bacterium]
MVSFLVEPLQVALTLLLAPGLVGLVRLLKARLQGRRGAPVRQPYRELVKLFGKERVVSRNASWIFHATPFVVLGTTLVVALLVPLLAAPLPLDGVGDLVVVAYLLLLGTFFLALAGLDPGSAFGGMGASREMTIAALAEPTLALAIFALAVGAGSTNLGRIVARTLSDPVETLGPGHVMAFAALAIVMIAECGRLPVDNPATHLELTMIHEAMLLEYSGPHLALLEWAGHMKFFLFLALISNLAFPWGVAVRPGPVALAIAVLALAVKVVLLAVGLAFLETQVAKLRLFRVPELLAVSFLLALLAVTTSFLVR